MLCYISITILKKVRIRGILIIINLIFGYNSHYIYFENVITKIPLFSTDIPLLVSINYNFQRPPENHFHLIMSNILSSS